MPEKRLLYTIDETVELLSLSRATLYRLTERGEIPTIKIGRAVRIPAAALEAWIAEQYAADGNGAGVEPTPLQDRSAAR